MNISWLRGVGRIFLVWSGMVLATWPILAQTSNRTSPEQAPVQRAPVVLSGKTLFYVQERVYSFSPEDRAKAITERIQRLYRNPQISLDAIRVEDQETATEIVAGDMVIMTVTDNDAKAAGRGRQELANQHAQVIRETVQELRTAYSLKTIGLGVLYSLIATLLLMLALMLMKKLFPRLYAKLRSWQGTRIRSLRIQKVELMSDERITDFLITLAKGIRLLATLVLLYVYLPLVFSFFPWTRGYAAVLFEYVLQPVRLVGAAIAEYIPNLLFVAVIVLVAHYAIKLVKFFFIEVGKGTIEWPGFYADWADPTFKIARFLIIVLAAVAAFPYLPGSKSPAFQGISLFLGLLFSLGSTSAVANLVGGVVLTYTRAFQVGDRVKIGETIGDVVGKTLLVTRVRTIKNVDISIPNSMVLTSHIINFSSSAQQHGLILHTSVTIGYDAPWRTVHELLLAAAAATPGILKEPRPFVFQTSLDDFYVTYEINAFTDQPAVMARIYSDLRQNIQDRFNEGGVEIMSPHYTQVRDGNPTTIPENYLSKEYSAPAFRILNLEQVFASKNNRPTSG
jgi:small-conductance mechanosensitive channel